jgi:hypothetical protein
MRRANWSSFPDKGAAFAELAVLIVAFLVLLLVFFGLLGL